jgi:hypothetical protein
MTSPAPQHPAPQYLVPVNTPSPVTARTLWLLALLTVATRAAYMLVSAKLRHIPLAEYPYYGDGPEFIAYARWLIGQAPAPSDYASRHFPGHPATHAHLRRTHLPLALASCLFHWSMAAVFVTASAALYRDWRIGLAMALVIPDLLLSTGGIQATEGPMLAFATLGLLCATRGHAVTGGVLLGVAGTYRPMACFAVLGYVCYAASRREYRRAVVVPLLSAVVVTAAVLALKHLWGDPLKGARAYANEPAAYSGDLLTWPFKSLLLTPLHQHVARPKLILVAAHVVLVLTACVLLIRRTINPARRAALDALALPWLLANTAFVLCVGSVWGFHAFPRFITPAAPAMFDALRRHLPNRGYTWTALGATSFLVAVAIFIRRGLTPG